MNQADKILSEMIWPKPKSRKELDDFKCAAAKCLLSGQIEILPTQFKFIERKSYGQEEKEK